MSVLKQLKGITKRTIKYLSKDVYDVNSDETLDNIIKNINKTMAENKPISFIPVFNLVLEDDPLFSDENLDIVFAYLKKSNVNKYACYQRCSKFYWQWNHSNIVRVYV